MFSELTIREKSFRLEIKMQEIKIISQVNVKNSLLI